MSKVISFSISDRYLDKLRSLYPTLTDNLAAKQFITGGLESSLSSSLDDSLDDGLDDKLKSLVESELDGILDERLDAVVGKLLTSLSERIERLEERLDTKLDGSLGDMELLLRMQQSASIASPLPTIEETVEAAIEPVATVETADKVETAIETVEAVTDTVEAVTDTVEIGSTLSTIELDKGAIGPVPGETDSIESVTGEAVTIGNKPWYTAKELLDCHYPGWPTTSDKLQEKADKERWPKRTRRGSKGKPYEYQAVLPD